MTAPNIPTPKPCPFCGYAKVEVSANKKDDTDGHVWCGNDECEADIYAGSRSEAVRRWNNRSIDRENVVLRRALNRYAKHDRDCPGHYGPCNCGLTEALTSPTTI